MDIMGVLGEAALGTQGTVVPYTVPAGKTARVRLQYRFVSGASSTFRVLINGMEIFRTGALTVAHCIFSTSSLIVNDAATEAAVNGSSLALTVAPFAMEYFLNENDNIQYIIATADCTSFSFQVVGVELSKV